MVTTRGRNAREDGAEASVTASGNPVPRFMVAPLNNVPVVEQNEEAPTMQGVLDQMQAMQRQMARTEQELLNVRAERDALLSRQERTGDSYGPRASRSHRTIENSPSRSHVVATQGADMAARVSKGANDVGSFRNSWYKVFLDCKPVVFEGGHDPVTNTRWLTEMEVVFESFDCPEDKKVLFASRMLKKSALDWWATRRLALGAEGVSAMTWASFIKMFKNEYCNTRDKQVLEQEFLTLKKGEKTVNEYAQLFMEKLQFCEHLCIDEEAKVNRYVLGLPYDYRGLCRLGNTLTHAIMMSKQLEDDRKGQVKKDNNLGFKRKNDGSSGSGKKFKGTSYKGKDERKKNEWCKTCRSWHSGPCSATTIRCNKCGKTGHSIRECTDEARCYKCKETGHRIADCPQWKPEEKKVEKPKAKARAFRITADEARDDDEVNK